MNTFVELKSKLEYFQEYLYQSYEYKKWSSKSWKKWSFMRGGICRNFSADLFYEGGYWQRGGIHSEYPWYQNQKSLIVFLEMYYRVGQLSWPPPRA